MTGNGDDQRSLMSRCKKKSGLTVKAIETSFTRAQGKRRARPYLKRGI
jgi:hypothetical protein